MGLGGWMFDGIDRFTMLGASGDPDVPGLGFRYDEDERWAMPNPTGLAGVFEALLPAALPRHGRGGRGVRRAQVRPGRPVQPRHARAWTDSPGVRGSAQVHDEAVQGLRRPAGAVHLRHVRQVPGHRADRCSS